MVDRKKLSDFADEDAQVNHIVETLVALHQAPGMPLEHTAFHGQKSNVLIGAVMSYAQGANSHLVLSGPVFVSKNLEFSIDELKAPFELAFENDINDISTLSDDAPAVLMKRMSDHEDAIKANDLVLAKELNEKIITGTTTLLNKVIEALNTKNAGFTVYEDYTLTTDINKITLVNGVGNKIEVPANVLITESPEGIQKIQSLEAPAVSGSLATEEERKLAEKMQKLMIDSSEYNDQVQRAINEFVKVKAGSEAEALFNKETAKRPAMPDDKRPKVTIVGAGPGGLFSAIRNYQVGSKVTIVEKREGYSRNNVFRLTPEVADALVKLYVDDWSQIQHLDPEHPLRKVVDCQSLAGKYSSPGGDFYSMSTKDFEYLANTWLEVMAKKDPTNMKIMRGYTYVEGSLNTPGQDVYVRSKDVKTTGPIPQKFDQKIPTEMLIAADGYNSICRKDAGIGVDVFSSSAPYGTFTYHTEREDKNAFFRSAIVGHKRNPEKTFDIKQLQALGWEKNTPPVARYFTTGDHPYLGIEVPQKLADMTDELWKKLRSEKDGEKKLKLIKERDKLMDTWGRACMQMFLPKTEVDKLIMKQHAVFPTTLQRANDAARRTRSGIEVIILGDALQSAHFQTGQGAITAIAEANDSALCAKGWIEGKAPDKVREQYKFDVAQKTLALHSLAFNFPSGEDLKTRPTGAFQNFRADTRVSILEKNPTALKTETAREARLKGRAKRRR